MGKLTGGAREMDGARRQDEMRRQDQANAAQRAAREDTLRRAADDRRTFDERRRQESLSASAKRDVEQNIAKAKMRVAEGDPRNGKHEVVERWMSRRELYNTHSSGLFRGGNNNGNHYATNNANSDEKRARQRLALNGTPEVRTKIVVPAETFSRPSPVQPSYSMPGGGKEREASGLLKIPAQIIKEFWK